MLGDSIVLDDWKPSDILFSKYSLLHRDGSADTFNDDRGGDLEIEGVQGGKKKGETRIFEGFIAQLVSPLTFFSY